MFGDRFDGASIISNNGAEIPPPGEGFTTATVAVPRVGDVGGGDGRLQARIVEEDRRPRLIVPSNHGVWHECGSGHSQRNVGRAGDESSGRQG